MIPLHSFANYKAIDVLGKGHFGIVYKAKNLGTNGEVALKIVSSQSANIADQVLEEAKNIQAAANKYTVKINTAFNIEVSGVHFSLIDMPLIRGGTIENLYMTNQLSIRDVLKSMRHILVGLSGIHAKGIIHKDVKPGNILVDNDSFILGDFGLAAEINITPTSNVAYVHHNPPELNKSHTLYDKQVIPSEKYDIYAAGMTFYRLLLPKSNFEISNKKYSDWCINPKGKTLPEFCGFPRYIPRRIKSIIKKATALDRNRRYDSTTEMKQAIDRLKVQINWTLPPSMPSWHSTVDVDRNHLVRVIEKKNKFEFKYLVNGRKPRGFGTHIGTKEYALQALSNHVNSTMLE